MLKVIFRHSNFLHKGSNNNLLKRFFLSSTYKCSETWENRLKNPAFQKIDFEKLYAQLDLTFKEKQLVSVLDIDLLTNCMSNYDFKNEFEDVLLKLRLCPECSILPERATHAAIRWYIDYGQKEDLLNVLGDRLNYGLFPDYYLVNLLIDSYLKKKDAVSAVKIAVLQMLQEDFEHPIMKMLALYSCYNYLASPEVWQGLQETETEPDEDVQKVRVPYIRNPYFDDHFDITDTNHLVGKTFLLIGESVDGTLGTSSQLIGLVLYEKFEKCVTFLESIIKNNSQVHAEAIVKAIEFTMKKPKQIEGKAKEQTSSEEKKPIEGEEKEIPDEWKAQVLKLLKEVKEKNLVQGDMLLETERLVKKAVEENEKSDIESQCQIYKQWEKDREDHIKMEIEKSQKKKLKSELEKTRKELEAEEEKLFFFDREEELAMTIEEQEKRMQSVVFYKAKKKEKVDVHDEYIPPEISKGKN